MDGDKNSKATLKVAFAVQTELYKKEVRCRSMDE